MCHPISFRFKQLLQLAQTSSPSFFAACLDGVLAIPQVHTVVDASTNLTSSQSSTVASPTEASDVDSSREL